MKRIIFTKKELEIILAALNMCNGDLDKDHLPDNMQRLTEASVFRLYNSAVGKVGEKLSRITECTSE